MDFDSPLEDNGMPECEVLDCPNPVAGWDDAAIQDERGDFHDGRVPLCQAHADEMGRILHPTEVG